MEDFAGAVGAELPAFVSTESGDHGQAEVGPEAKPMLSCAQAGGDVAAMMTKGQQQGAEENDDAHLDERGPVLKVGALTGAPDVYDRDDSYHHDGSDGLLCGRNRKNPGEIFTEGARQGSNGAAGDHEKKTPAVEKSGEPAETIANVAIQTACFGIGGGEFSVGESAEQGEASTHGPNQERKADGAVNLAKDGAWRSKDAGANDGADEEKKKIAKAKCADEFRHEYAGAAWRAQTEGIITGFWKRSMGSWGKVERRGHETEEKDEKCKKCSPLAIGVARRGIGNGRGAKQPQADEQCSPNGPALPETK